MSTVIEGAEVHGSMFEVWRNWWVTAVGQTPKFCRLKPMSAWFEQRTMFEGTDRSERCLTVPFYSGAATRHVVETARSSGSPCPAPFSKKFPFAVYPNQIYIPRRPASLEGRIAIVTDARWDAVDAGSVRRAMQSQGGFPVSDQKAR
jgi:hypothetical protein